MSQMLDLAQGTWAVPLLETLDLPVERFPELRRAGSDRRRAPKRGGLCHRAAGGPAGARGGGDTHLSALSTALPGNCPRRRSGDGARSDRAGRATVTDRMFSRSSQPGSFGRPVGAREQRRANGRRNRGQLAPLSELSGERLRPPAGRCFLIEETSIPLLPCSLGTRASDPWVGRTRLPPPSLACGYPHREDVLHTRLWRVAAMPYVDAVLSPGGLRDTAAVRGGDRGHEHQRCRGASSWPM